MEVNRMNSNRRPRRRRRRPGRRAWTDGPPGARPGRLRRITINRSTTPSPERRQKSLILKDRWGSPIRACRVLSRAKRSDHNMLGCRSSKKRTPPSRVGRPTRGRSRRASCPVQVCPAIPWRLERARPNFIQADREECDLAPWHAAILFHSAFASLREVRHHSGPANSFGRSYHRRKGGHLSAKRLPVP